MSYTVEIGERADSDVTGALLDTKVSPGTHADTNYSTAVGLGMKYVGLSNDFTEVTLMQIDLATLFAGRTVEDVTLQLYSGPVQASNSVNVKKMTSPWTSGVTFNKYDGVNAWDFWAIDATLSVLFSFQTTQGTPYFIDLTGSVALDTYFQNCINGTEGAPLGTANLSWVSNNNLNLYPASSRAVDPAQRPIVTIQFAGDPPVEGVSGGSQRTPQHFLGYGVGI